MTGVSDSLHAVMRKRFVNPNPILTLPDLANAEDLGALDPFPLPTLNLGLPHLIRNILSISSLNLKILARSRVHGLIPQGQREGVSVNSQATRLTLSAPWIRPQ